MDFSPSFTTNGEPFRVRSSILKGKWYEGTAPSLESQVDTLLREARLFRMRGAIRALISPHSGYGYSGLCAAHGYKALVGQKYRRVIILAPSHYGRFRGVSVLPFLHYETPLGLVEVDQEATRRLLAHSLVASHHEAEMREHSLEIQLPFLQRTLSEFRLLPLLIGQARLSSEEYRLLAEELKQFIDSQTLLIVSSNFTHYGPRFGFVPFDRDVSDRIQALDSHALARIEALDFDGFLGYVNSSGTNICGFQPIALLLKILSEVDQGQRLHYVTSGKLTGDYHNSVSYASVAFAPDPDWLNAQERKDLLSLARQTLETHLRTNRNLNVEGDDGWAEKLRKKRGAFVTIQREGKLRGCIGTVLPIKPLYEAVRDNAINASVHDPRFPPLSAEDLDKITIEVSVLSPLTRLTSLEDIHVGRHGLVIRKGGRNGLLLPKVAADYGWDRKTFLENVCLKASLLSQDWREGAELYCFTAQSFREPGSVP